MLRYYHDLERKIQSRTPPTLPHSQVTKEALAETRHEEVEDLVEISPGRFAKKLTTVKHVFTRSKAPRSEIVRVRIVAASPEWIRKVSVCEIVNNIPQGKNNSGKREGTLEDPRLGPRDRLSPCVTCFKDIEECPGHRAYISLPLPSYNILYMDILIQILRCVCFFCSRPLLQPNDPQGRYYKLSQHQHQMKRLSEQANISKTIEYCGGKPPDPGTSEGASLDFSQGCHNRQPLYYLKKKNKLMIVVHRRPPHAIKKPSKSKRNKKQERKRTLSEISTSSSLGSPKSPDSPSSLEEEDVPEVIEAEEEEEEVETENDYDVSAPLDSLEEESLPEQEESLPAEENPEVEEQPSMERPPSVSVRFGDTLDLRAFLSATPSNLEWSKLERLLPSQNSLNAVIPALFPSAQSSAFPLHSQCTLPLPPVPPTATTKRKFSYYSREEDNERRIPFWPADALDILRRIKDEDLLLLGLTPLSRPDWLIWQDFPVAPPHTRIAAAVGLDSNSKPRTNTDNTRQLNKVVTCVRTLRSRMKRVQSKVKEMFSELKDTLHTAVPKKKQPKEVTLEALVTKFYDAYMQMMMFITQFIDSDAKHIPFPSQKPFKGVTTKMKRKDGRVRSNVSCKRVNFCGRTVIIAADVGLDVNEIGLPLMQCMKLTKPVRLTKYNMVKLRQRILNGPDKYPGATSIIKPDGKIIDLSTARKLRFGDLKFGDIVNCHLENGDIVLNNRQPSLHGPSIMAHYVRVLPPFLSPTMPFYAMMLPLPVTPAYNADFDGDEMNIHVPQNEVAQAEALFLMIVQMMITTRACIGPVQDAVLGAHRLSAPDCFFERDEIMQILMQCKYLDFWIGNSKKGFPEGDSQELPIPAVEIREKDKWIPLWTGKQVVSFLLPPHFYFRYKAELTSVELASKPAKLLSEFAEEQAILARLDDPALCLVKSGEFLLGRLRKVNFGTHTESMIQKCCLDFGPDYTMKLLSDFQRIVAQLWTDKGFSMGLEHEQVQVRRDCNLFIKHGLQLVQTLSAPFSEASVRKCLGKLWSQTSTVPPPPSVVAEWDTIVHLFYRQPPSLQKHFLQLLLNKITDVTGKRYLTNISSQPESHMKELVASGTKPSTIHVMQITGILGSSSVQGKGIPRNYARDRALPHYTPGNLHPQAMGFLVNGFESGLTPLEMYFNALQGRESLVHVVSQTPLLGYAQRRFLRNFEDISIAYDYTVRDPTGIVTFLNGDDGFDETHIEKQNYYCLSWGKEKIVQHFGVHSPFGDAFQPGELANTGTPLWLQRATPEVQKECLERRQELDSLLQQEVEQILDDVVRIRQMKLFYHPSPPLDSHILTAIHFRRLLEIHRSQMLSRTHHKPFANDLSPFAILEGVKRFKQYVRKTIQYRSSMLSFFALLHIHVCVKKILLLFQLDATQFALFLRDLEGKYLNSLSVPGYPNGTNASQVMGQNITQTNFNSHKTSASAGNTVSGIHRINECTTASRKIKEPSMETFLEKEYQTPRKIRALVTQMKMITLGNVVASCHLLYNPLPNQQPQPQPPAVATGTASPKESDEREKQWNLHFATEDARLLSTTAPLLYLQENSKSRVQYHNYSEYVVRLELHREKLLELGKNIYDVVDKIQKELLGGKHLWIVSPVFASTWVIRIRLNRKAAEFSKRVKVKGPSRTEKQTVQCLVDILLTKITFNGLDGIKDVLVHEREQIRWHPETLEVSKEKELYLVTEGTNLQEVLNLRGVDHRRTISNDIHEVNQVLGIDAACNVLLKEISKVLDNSKVHIDSHHLHVLKASIGKGGYFERVSRFGFGRNRKRGWMKRCSFEELVRNLKESALAGEIDDLQDNASCTMVGKHVPLGTHGPFELLEDLKLSEERIALQRQPAIPEVLPSMTQQELEGIIPILVPPYTPLQSWCQAGLNDNKIHMDYRWQRYEMGKERHVPDYTCLLKNPPLPPPSETIPAVRVLQPRPAPVVSLTPLKLLDRHILREVTLQHNIRKKCQLFLFKKKKKPLPTKKRKTSSKDSSSHKKRHKKAK